MLGGLVGLCPLGFGVGVLVVFWVWGFGSGCWLLLVAFVYLVCMRLVVSLCWMFGVYLFVSSFVALFVCGYGIVLLLLGFGFSLLLRGLFC